MTEISAKINQIEKEMPNQLATISAKLNEIDNRKEPVFAFRVTSVKDSGSSSQQSVSKSPGKMNIVKNNCRTNCIYFNLEFLSNISLSCLAKYRLQYWKCIEYQRWQVYSAS